MGVVGCLKNRAADRVLKPTASAIYRSMVNNFHFAAVVDPCRKYREGILLCSIRIKKKKKKGKKMVIPDEQVDGKVKWDAWNRGEWLLKPLSPKPRIDVIEVSTINPSI